MDGSASVSKETHHGMSEGGKGEVDTVFRNWESVNLWVQTGQGLKCIVLCIVVGFYPPSAEKLGLDVDVIFGDIIAYMICHYTAGLRKPPVRQKAMSGIESGRRRSFAAALSSAASAAVLTVANGLRIARAVTSRGGSVATTAICVVDFLVFYLTLCLAEEEIKSFWTDKGQRQPDTTTPTKNVKAEVGMAENASTGV